MRIEDTIEEMDTSVKENGIILLLIIITILRKIGIEKKGEENQAGGIKYIFNNIIP